MAIAVRPAHDARPALLGHDHDARYDLRYAPIGGGGVPVDAYTKAESDARFEPIDTMYTKSESDARYPLKTDPDPFPTYLTQSEADVRYALASALTALTTRVTTLEAQVATLQSQMTGHTHITGTIARVGGTPVMP